VVGLLAVAMTAVFAVPATSETRTSYPWVRWLLKEFVDAKNGPVSGIVTMHEGGHTTVIAAGRADAKRPGAPRLDDHMRIASVTKAFTAAIALHLVQRHELKLDQTIGELLPGEMPRSWSKVTVRQMLDHTSDLPDYTKSAGFFEQATKDPHGFVSPAKIIDWVRGDDRHFTPGAKYEYSNTDNIVVALIAEKLTHRSFTDLLRNIVFKRAGLRQTSFDMHRMTLPSPFIHGYQLQDGTAEDVTTALSPSGAWASGGIVSTPGNLAKFVRADLSLRFFGRAQQRSQMRFVKGNSSPEGPGSNAAGLGLFRYRTRCGVVYGHTGEFPGYVQFMASSANGKRSVTTTFSLTGPTGATLQKMRRLQAAAVCALLRK
jgi:D-alanyl-D-alanine carboxypeptidase